MMNMRRIRQYRWNEIFLLLILTLPWIVLPMAIYADDGFRKMINCDAHDGACVQPVGDTKITLEITPRPVTAMKDLVFVVSLAGDKGAPKAPPVIDLNMPMMEMGPNQVKMTPIGPKKHEGKGVIVKCASGHRVWKATVTVPELGKADFIFDVVY